MVRFRSLVCFLVVCLFFALFSGCEPAVKDVDPGKVVKPAVKADVGVKYAAGAVGTYRFGSEMIQEIIFDQPAIKKSKVDQVKIDIDVEFDQEIEKVNPDGSALAKITFRDIRVFWTAPKGVVFDFDSEREADKKSSAYQLIGRSYTVNLLPDGSAKAVETKKALVGLRGFDETQLAGTLLSDKAVSQRHAIPGLPGVGQNLKGVGESWSKISIGHELLLPPKAFKKTYKVSNIEEKGGKDIVLVSMDAVESDEPVEGLGETSPIAAFIGPMVDGQETYSGEMTFDSTGGGVVGYNEKLVANYATTGEAMGVTVKMDPDMMKFNLTYSISLESVKSN